MLLLYCLLNFSWAAVGVVFFCDKGDDYRAFKLGVLILMLFLFQGISYLFAGSEYCFLGTLFFFAGLLLGVWLQGGLEKENGRDEIEGNLEGL